MNMYRHELRCYRKNTLLWICSLCLGAVFMFWMFPAFASNTVAISEVLRNYPEAVQKAFGLSADRIGTVTGFYSFIITFFMVCGAVQATALGMGVLAKETTGKTADFLLTKPLPRARVLTAKLAAVWTCVTLTALAFVAATLSMALAVSPAALDWTPFMLMSLAFYFVQIIFLTIGFAMGAIVPKIRSVLPVAMSTVFGFFIVGTVASALGQTKLYYLSPFKYFDTTAILETSAYRPSYTAMAALVTLLCVLAGYAVYGRRDIRAS